MKNLELKVENGVQTLEVRTGEALPIHEPKIVNLSGVLNTPLKWLEKRVELINEKECHITVDRENLIIKLVIDETNHYQTTISGKLEFNPIFVKFGINSGLYRTPLELSEFIKMNRSHFENQNKAMELVSILKAFKAKINKDVETEVNLNKGDRKMLLAQTVESNMPEGFFLEIPIFKAQKKVRFEVETYFNPDDLTCTLVSPSANDQIQETSDNEIDKIIDEIQNIAPGIAILEV